MGQPKPGRTPACARLLLAWILAWLPLVPAFGAPPPLTLATDLATDGGQARARGIPVVILFSRARCGWCDKARREHLNAMAAQAGDGAGSALFRQVDMDADSPLIGFDGKRTTYRSFATLHKIRLTPTLIFLGGDGSTLADPIVGYRLPEFYGTIIENAIEASRQRLREQWP
jgi:thioredoxin-related protein